MDFFKFPSMNMKRICYAVFTYLLNLSCAFSYYIYGAGTIPGSIGGMIGAWAFAGSPWMCSIISFCTLSFC